MPTTVQQVKDAYHAITRKTLDDPTAQSTADNINNGGQTFEQYVTFTIKLKSTMDTAGAVLKIFQILTGKTPDAPSFDSIVSTITDINTQHGVAAGYTAIGADLATWAGSTQFNALYKNTSVTDFVISAHQDVFGVTPGDVDSQIATYNIYKAFYGNSPIPADMSGDLRARGALLADFVHQANDIALRDNSTTFPWGATNKYVVAEYNFQENAVDGTAVYGGSLFTQPGYMSGSTLILTAGADTLAGTSNDDLFDARVDGYLGTSDIINGGAGTDTIEARYTAANQTVAPKLTSVENVFVRVDAAGFDFTFDASDSVGIQALWADRLAGTNGDILNLTGVAKSTAVGVKDGDGNMVVTAAFTNAAGGSDAATLRLQNANVATVNIAAIETLAVENTGTSTVALLNAPAATALNISGTGTATLTDITLAAASTIGITGAVNVATDLGQATTVSAATATGNITLTNVGAVAGNIVITTGSGADVLNVGANIAAVAGAQDTIDLGGGIDRVVVNSDIADGNFDRISAYEEVEVIGAARVVDMDAFNGTTVGLFATGTGNFTVNNFVTTTAITARTDLATVSLQADVGANAVATLNLNPTPTDGVDIANLTSANVQTLNINSLAGLLAVSESNSISLDNVNNTLTTINVTGNGALALTNAEVAVATINAATFTGAATIAVDAAAADLSVTTGSGNDSVTLAAGIISANDVLNGGAGNGDILTITGADGVSTGTATVTNFETVAFNLANVNAYTADLASFAGYTALNLDISNALGTVAFSNILGSATVGVTGAMANTGNLSLAFMGTTGNATLGAFSGVTGVQTLTIDEATVNLTAATNTTIDLLAGPSMTALNLITGAGNDVIISSATNTTALASIVVTGTGDVELGTIAGATVARTAGATVTTGSGNDLIVVDIVAHGANVISAGTGNDTLGLTGAAAGTVIIDLSSGTDQIVSVNGTGNAAAQTGFDNVNASTMTGFGINVTGSTADNVLVGSAQIDTLNGGDGADTISGGGGADIINGGIGADIITGGAGVDNITLGAGADRVEFVAANVTGADADILVDFSLTGDVDVIAIDVSAAGGGIAAGLADGARVNIAGSASNSFIVDTAGTGYANFAAAELAVETDSTGTLSYALMFFNTTSNRVELYIDADSSDVNNGVLLATFDNITADGAADAFLTGFVSANYDVF